MSIANSSSGDYGNKGFKCAVFVLCNKWICSCFSTVLVQLSVYRVAATALLNNVLVSD